MIKIWSYAASSPFLWEFKSTFSGPVEVVMFNIIQLSPEGEVNSGNNNETQSVEVYI